MGMHWDGIGLLFLLLPLETHQNWSSPEPKVCRGGRAGDGGGGGHALGWN